VSEIETLELLKRLAVRDRVLKAQKMSREVSERQTLARVRATLQELKGKTRIHSLPPTLFINQAKYPLESAQRLLVKTLQPADFKDAAECLARSYVSSRREHHLWQ
jgi:hypothetical protein